MSEAVAKLDLCGSKEFFDRRQHQPEIRRTTLDVLIHTSRAIFPKSDANYPDGSFYAAQGDCVYYILDNATVAVRCAVDMLREWAGMAEELPDCRAIVDVGTIEVQRIGTRIELSSPAFENIAEIEKLYGPGEIGVTDAAVNQTDRSLVTFIRSRETSVTRQRTVISWLANYENPRLLEDSSLVHALFIAPHSSRSVRDRTYEAVIIESLMERKDDIARIVDIHAALHAKQCPAISNEAIREIVGQSPYLDVEDDDIRLSPEAVEQLTVIRDRFLASRDDFANGVAVRFSEQIGLKPEVIRARIDIPSLLERYICAIFLELRFMASYLVATHHVFDTTSRFSDFDYIIKREAKNLRVTTNESFLFFKRAFLDAIKRAIAGENAYVASVFHNVLMLYYLNRNERYIHAQLRHIRKKRIYFDTNTLYAHMCESSEHHVLVEYAVRKLRMIGVTPHVFDRSVQEYNDSISSVASVANRADELWLALEYDPWILREYESNRSAYNNNLSYCISMHRIPAGDDAGSLDQVAAALTNRGLKLDRLDPFLDQMALGETYSHVYEAKQRYDADTGEMEVRGNPDMYHLKVLHDANCLKLLENEGETPYELARLFVTCDYRLARVRKNHTRYDCIVTIREFYEFMMPYLLLSDSLSGDPVEIPRFLLASAISLELASTKTLERVVGEFLSERRRVTQDFEILARTENRRRFELIRAKIEQLNNSTKRERETEEQLLSDLGRAIGIYKESVREAVGRAVVAGDIESRDKKIADLQVELTAAKQKIDVYEKKQKGRRRYQRAQARRTKST